MTQVVEVKTTHQYILAGDISGSMTQTDPRCANTSRYSYMLEKFQSFIQLSEDFDPDGPTVLLFGEKVQTFRNTTLDAVKANLSNPNFESLTQTDLVIQEAWNLHKGEKAELAAEGKVHPGTVLLLFTDGEPTNRKAVERVITEIANNVDKADEFHIVFLLVGTIDANLKEFLTHLDNDLKSAKYDIVDVKELDQVSFMKALEVA